MRKPTGLSIVTGILFLTLAGCTLLYMTDDTEGASFTERINHRFQQLSAPVIELVTGRDPVTGRDSETQLKIDEDRTIVLSSISGYNHSDSQSEKNRYLESIMTQCETMAKDLTAPASVMDTSMGLAFGKTPEEVGIGRSDDQKAANPQSWDDYRLQRIYLVRAAYVAIDEAEDEEKEDCEKQFIETAKDFADFSKTSPND